jgi:hypothetical protein
MIKIEYTNNENILGGYTERPREYISVIVDQKNGNIEKIKLIDKTNSFLYLINEDNYHYDL